ncbi:Ig-like domain-containing protein [Vagococcus hydrophili]|uniref:Bacterial Ig domain-containing protein n=1 Tax=Vagococcus hydrophili TaxID=2714947 RepID=A0A6G8ATK2_9ENTE|nr:Ig-like domain-containing protein [Vagococcus hydrophili]QIL48253.1 hypothetical protein G7082_06990 [Vagococcus hydrophili]
MKKTYKWLAPILLVMMFFSASTLTGVAEDKKDDQLLYDLKYDKDKSVLSGKTKPNANIYIKDVAGSVVADDKGGFEIPIPKNMKKSPILMLDAEGNNSTDVRYDFEKNTIEKEEKEASTKDSTKTSDKEASSSKDTKKDKDSKEGNVAISDNKESQSTSDSTKESKDKKDGESNSKELTVSSENYKGDKKEEPRSLVWLWTLLAILVVGGAAVGGYFWYKKKVEKEEAAERKRKRSSSSKKKKSKESLDADFEDDLYEAFKDGKKTSIKGKHAKSSHSKKDVSLDQLIDSELEKQTTKPSKKRRSSSSSSGKKRKKSSKK